MDHINTNGRFLLLKIIIVRRIPVAVGDNGPATEWVNSAGSSARPPRWREGISPRRRWQGLPVATLITPAATTTIIATVQATVSKDRILGDVTIGATVLVGVAGTGLPATRRSGSFTKRRNLLTYQQCCGFGSVFDPYSIGSGSTHENIR